MRKLMLITLTTGLFVSQAFALFANGGFELGNTTGWSISGDHSVISSYTPQFIVTDPTWSSQIPYYGNYSLLLGSPNIGNETDNFHHSSAVSTDGIVTQQDIDNGLHLYFRWGALLEEPTNGVIHTNAQQPYFSAKVETFDGTSWTQRYFTDHRANQPGFTKIGRARSGDAGDIWYGSAVTDLDLSTLGLGVNDQVRVSMFVQDCSLGGHGGLVFLDGFGTTRPPSVPEPSTISLLGIGLLSLFCAFRKRIK